MKTLKSILAAMLVVVLFAGILTAQTKTGRDIFLEAKCNTCHAIEKSEITSKGKAPDLGNNPTQLVDDNLKAYLNKEADLNGKKHPVKYKGTPEDLDILMKYLMDFNAAD